MAHPVDGGFITARQPNGLMRIRITVRDNLRGRKPSDFGIAAKRRSSVPFTRGKETFAYQAQELIGYNSTTKAFSSYVYSSMHPSCWIDPLNRPTNPLNLRRGLQVRFGSVSAEIRPSPIGQKQVQLRV